MKRISTKNMDPKDKQMLRGNLLGSLGNDNIRGHHIAFFEKKLIESKENRNADISSAPYYYAWLCLITEHLFWAMRSFCYKTGEFKENDDLTLLYNNLITKFCDTCLDLKLFDNTQLQNAYDKAVTFLELRHAIIHKGFPNLLPIVFEDRHVRNKPQKTKGEQKAKFTRQSTKASVQWFSDPKNFSEINNDFRFLLKIMNSGHSLSIGF